MVRLIKESKGGTVLLKNMNTDVLPVVDFGCYWGALKGALDDVFDYEYIELDNFDPDEEYYDEVVDLVNEKYDGTDIFFDQVERYAPGTIQDAFNDYGIAITVVPNSCNWYHPREYNFSDDCMQFDAQVDTGWVASKLRELSGDPNFRKFINKEYSSRDGFMSFMPNDVDEYNGMLDPNSTDYWKVVSAIVSFMVSEDPTICNDVTDGLVESVETNADYVRCSSLGIFY